MEESTNIDEGRIYLGLHCGRVVTVNLDRTRYKVRVYSYDLRTFTETFTGKGLGPRCVADICAAEVVGHK